ncbi:MAG: type II toxin-antitoxin system HigA family antitoxin [Microcystis sp.]|jgi:HTH-type transcriptional regulator/antitoxin HigA|uniref:Transcriptional regulator n=1 Tax=Microcystis aeruginosa G11-04 TaxID=2685956 RepID=A0A966FYX0_MICAE|nr:MULTISPECIES: transcriptional regulator [unclassified Microcystis]MCU7244771.1 transcriptional regulator [Microcystis aeruginosa WS75]NCR13833.1 transcriptional regulator [Microcystis aeruginosa SX13-11]NCR18224.1 transcriptional regulator [Microcystis aeruginosa LL13-03]NCR27560.1 transcriptional regulator [Microcystis aeruginosa LE13-04]NCR45625.1 transcriptional regulator [Microcystis aeruginosa SX13-01]NCR67902.1 transcriptional regulator [Microcystis aeruginosa LL11-07]NCR89798.1 tra
MFATDKYLELLKQYPPRPIHNEEDLEMMQEVINRLLDKPQLTAEEREYLNVLGALIYEHEENQEPIPDIYGLELLKFILEERNLQKQDLLSIFESKSTLDDIFDGLQELTPIYIQKLANFLNISPDLFFPS